MSDSDLKIQFGVFTLHVGFKIRFAGNAYFNHRANPSDEYEKLCQRISKELNKDYHDQNGRGKRVWGKLNESDIEKLKTLGEAYSKNCFLPKKKEFVQCEVLAEEVRTPGEYIEGATKKIFINVYERNANARKKCIEHYGFNCTVCRFNFESVYGELGVGFIHVHHLKPLSEVKETYELDPINDLRPVCPNCHAMLHRTVPALSIETLLSVIESMG